MTRTEKDETIVATITHSEFGDTECCGCLCFVVREDQVVIVCDKCQNVIQIVSGSELKEKLDGLLSVRAVSSIAISSILVANSAASIGAQFTSYC